MEAQPGMSMSIDSLLKNLAVRPKETFSYLLKNSTSRYINLLFILGGVVRSIDSISNPEALENQKLVSVLFGAIVTGVIFGWISFFLFSALIRWTGEWLHGKATFRKLRTVIAWSLLPSVCTLVIVLPQIFFFGRAFLLSDWPSFELWELILILVLFIIKLLLGLWSIVLMVMGVAHVQGFTIWKAVLNMLLPVTVLALPFFLIGIVNSLLG